MNNFVREGLANDYVAPSGGVIAGVAILIGTLLVIPATTEVEGDSYSGWIEGVYELPCATSSAWAMHDVLYWDNTNKRVTKTSTSNTKIGIAAAPKDSAAATGHVKLIPTI